MGPTVDVGIADAVDVGGQWLKWGGLSIDVRGTTYCCVKTAIDVEVTDH